MESIGKKRFEILAETYPKLARAAKIKFVSEHSDNHIIYFDAFKSVPIKVDEFSVDPKHWALAFLQPDIQSVADILCRAIFTPEDLIRRNSAGSIDVLPSIEQVAIERTAKWMMNKCQDPWSYTPSLWPTNDEQSSIDRAYESFDSVYPRESEVNSKSAMEEEAIDLGTEMDFEITRSSNYLINGFGSKEETVLEILDNFEYEIVFKNYAALATVKNTAHIARDFTKLTIPRNSDIFVDAVQFSRGRWAKALTQKNSVQIADVLFRKYLKLDFMDEQIEFRSWDDICPIKRLALIRAVAWILNKEKWTDLYDFDSAIPEHNLFLPIEEIQHIANAITLKYGKQATNVAKENK